MNRPGDVVFLIFLLAALIRGSWPLFFIGLGVGILLNAINLFWRAK
jgi:ABC-type bacteriocin/lantibiotic exporter with double-glycine peptidase domain